MWWRICTVQTKPREHVLETLQKHMAPSRMSMSYGDQTDQLLTFP